MFTYPRSLALVIGLDKYQNQPRQPGAVRNADAVSSCLRWQYKLEVATLLDQQATRGAVTRELTRLQNADFAIIYFAGRALPDADTLCLFSTDAAVPNSGLSLSRLLRQVEAFPARHVLLIIDAPIERPEALDALPAYLGLNADLFNEKARIILASGPTAFTSRERWGDDDATPFTAQVLLGLRGAAADPAGVITAARLAEYVAAELPRNSKGKAASWSGGLPGFAADIVLRAEAPPELPYGIADGLRSGSPFQRYRAVELLAYLIDKADPILSVLAIDKLREIANDNDSANVRKMAVDELYIRDISVTAGNVPRLRESPEPRSGSPDLPPPSDKPAPPLPDDKRQTAFVFAVIIGVFALVAFMIFYFR